MNNKTLTQLANQIIALRRSTPAPPLPHPLTYKSGGNTGAMIALFLPTSTGSRFVQSDPGALPLNELHVTLAYLGKADNLSLRQAKDAHDLMRLISENHPPLTGHINGCGRFCNGDDDGDPFFVIPDLAALPNLRQAIIDGLRNRDIHSANDHGFVPHITLTYLPHAEYNPFDIVEKTPVTFGAISLVLGDDRYDYPLTQGVPLLSKADFIEKIGARHTHNETALIQKIHDLALDLGGECHPLTRRAGARHSRGDQAMVQRIHDDCAGLGAACKALPEKDRVYGSQILKEVAKGGIISKEQIGDALFGEIIITKAQSDAPNYGPAQTPQRCANCRFFLGDPGRDWCDLFDFTADRDYHCDAWESQKPDEIPGYVANKADLAALTEGVLALRGGPTSGNWAHGGRPGKRGGSGRGGGFKRIGVKDGKKAGRKGIKRASRQTRAKDERGKQEAKKKNAKPIGNRLNAKKIISNSQVDKLGIKNSDKSLNGKKSFLDIKNDIAGAIKVIDDALPKMAAAGIDMKKAAQEADGIFRSAIRKRWGGSEVEFFVTHKGNKAITAINQRHLDGIAAQVVDHVSNFKSEIKKKAALTTRAQSDAPNYGPAQTPQRCANCRFFLGDPGRDWCDLFDFIADQDYHCDAWESQKPDEIPGYVANKADLAALTEGVLALRGGAKLT